MGLSILFCKMRRLSKRIQPEAQWQKNEVRKWATEQQQQKINTLTLKIQKEKKMLETKEYMPSDSTYTKLKNR